MLCQWDWRWAEAEQAFAQALKLNPSYAEAEKERGLMFTFLGRTGEAHAALERARALDPFSPVMIGSRAMADYFERQYDRVLEPMTQALRALPRVYLPHFFLGLSHVHRGAMDVGIEVLERGRATIPDSGDILGALGYAYGVAGQRRKAFEALDGLRHLGTHHYVSPFVMVYPFIGLGDHDAALAQLERAFAAREWQIITLKVDPALDPLRFDLRFGDLVRRMNFPD